MEKHTTQFEDFLQGVKFLGSSTEMTPAAAPPIADEAETSPSKEFDSVEQLKAEKDIVAECVQSKVGGVSVLIGKDGSIWMLSNAKDKVRGTQPTPYPNLIL